MMKLAGIFGILRNEDERNMIEISKVYQQYIGSDQNKLRAQAWKQRKSDI